MTGRTDQLEAVHNASLRLLEEYGIEVMSGHARAIFQAAGAEVDDSTMIVRADRDTKPSAWTQCSDSVCVWSSIIPH